MTAPAYDLVIVFGLDGDFTTDQRHWNEVVGRLIHAGFDVDGKLVEREKRVAACLYAPDEVVESLANRSR
jgi:hypothetical protein